MYIVNADQTLSRDTQLAVVSVPPSYTVGFEITPDSSTVASWGSIVHFTTDSDSGDGGRIPGVWFYPGSRRLHVRDGDVGDSNAGCDPAEELPAGQTTTVRIDMKPRSVEVWYNDELKCQASRAGRPSYEQVFVYAGDPWWEPANAQVNGLYMARDHSSSSAPAPSPVGFDTCGGCGDAMSMDSECSESPHTCDFVNACAP